MFTKRFTQSLLSVIFKTVTLLLKRNSEKFKAPSIEESVLPGKNAPEGWAINPKISLENP